MYIFVAGLVAAALVLLRTVLIMPELIVRP